MSIYIRRRALKRQINMRRSRAHHRIGARIGGRAFKGEPVGGRQVGEGDVGDGGVVNAEVGDGAVEGGIGSCIKYSKTEYTR